MPNHKNTVEGFWKKVNKRGPRYKNLGRCWEWTKGTKNRYGQTSYEGIHYYAHRLSWILSNGIVPDGQLVLHHCDNRLCVNPKHLFLGTYQDNMDDCVSKNRQCRGSMHSQATLSEEDVLEIRRRYICRHKKHGATALSIEFGVCRSTIRRAISKVWWKHV